MKTEFKAKFLQQLNKKRQDKGFTLIELLVVIIIIGILSAIALPAFLNQANKAKQSEGKQYISSINKGQQAYYAENTQFGTDVTVLGLGLKTATTNYSYAVTGASATADATARPTNPAALKGYAGGVGLVDAGEAKTTQSVLCETSSVGDPAISAYSASSVDCGTGMVLVTK
ncbi:type IV pilin-like G/H family protein [Tychonema sp. LEGE 07203]|uniref:type IV pilin-like G/H family protein n=1 Tax=Tychonema sp. LEGE 07203 TaxID=1828671 RepID=UPI001882596F|nr:type IV pilin-like G/H family protein [Tychonema sp. LEGE 07203]MBE9095500.1 type IV pilin-like G/H family protein [Tychonema sp. LEGE 07203]